MAQAPQNLNVNVDLKNTQPITSSTGGKVFAEGVILRKVSKFVAGTDSDAIMPIPVFYDPTNGNILGEGIPVELREELKDELA